jgi:two-component system LytT family response regulator
MKAVTAIIIDDEEHNRNVLRALLTKHTPAIEVVGEAAGANNAFTEIQQLKPQLVFLDIKMPVKSGFDLLKMFETISFEVIFVSAFNEYAITAFEFNALGYILKPIDFSKLITVVEKAVAKIRANTVNENVFHFIKTLEEKNDLINKIPVHHNEKVVLLNVSELISVEVKDAICELRMNNGMRYYSSKDLKLFEDMLEKIGNFVRINKSVIININQIKSYSKGELCVIEMVNEISLEVSRRKKTEVLRKIKFL